MVAMTSEKGHEFNNMLCLHGEVSPMRYQGIHKNIGSQYIRGIVEGNGNPPGKYLWNTYSMNKEDIWVTRTRIPISGETDQHVNESFDQIESVEDLELWNMHIPLWAQASIADDPYNENNRCLKLTDEDPYEYALADVAFPESKHVTIQFRVNPYQIGHGLLEVELHDKRNKRALRLRFDPEWLSLDILKTETLPVPMRVGEWYNIAMKINCMDQTYDLSLNDELVKQQMPFAEQMDTVERLVFRTGSWRSDVRPLILDGAPGNSGLYMEDLPGADQKVAMSLYYIDDVQTVE